MLPYFLASPLKAIILSRACRMPSYLCRRTYGAIAQSPSHGWKVAFKHDWQLSCSQLDRFYPCSTNTSTGYSWGRGRGSSGAVKGKAPHFFLVLRGDWLALCFLCADMAGCCLFSATQLPTVRHPAPTEARAPAAVGNKHLVTSRSMKTMPESTAYTSSLTFPSLRLSDHICTQYHPCCSRLPHCLAIWSLLWFYIVQNPMVAQFAVWTEVAVAP